MHYYTKDKNNSPKNYKKILGIFLIATGILSLVYFFFPVMSYQLFIASAYEKDNIEVPIPKYLVADKSVDFASLISQGISNLTTDFTDARNWYPKVPDQLQKTALAKSDVSSYLLSIPRLKIENATVSTKDYDLSQHLVQYFGTALPSQKGTAVIFGHSTLPQWFDPKNYKAIFATLHTIKTGDEILITISGKTYNYKIFSIIITSPDDVNILTQSYDNSYLTIVTCTPPGTIWKRLIVRAALET